MNRELCLKRNGTGRNYQFHCVERTHFCINNGLFQRLHINFGYSLMSRLFRPRTYKISHEMSTLQELIAFQVVYHALPRSKCFDILSYFFMPLFPRFLYILF